MRFSCRPDLVHEPGIEPGHLSALEPKSSAFTDFATRARYVLVEMWGIEPQSDYLILQLHPRAWSGKERLPSGTLTYLMGFVRISPYQAIVQSRLPVVRQSRQAKLVWG